MEVVMKSINIQIHSGPTTKHRRGVIPGVFLFIPEILLFIYGSKVAQHCLWHYCIKRLEHLDELVDPDLSIIIIAILLQFLHTVTVLVQSAQIHYEFLPIQHSFLLLIIKVKDIPELSNLLSSDEFSVIYTL